MEMHIEAALLEKAVEKFNLKKSQHPSEIESSDYAEKFSWLFLDSPSKHKKLHLKIFNIICSMHCDYNQPHTPTKAYILYKITDHLYT